MTGIKRFITLSVLTLSILILSQAVSADCYSYEVYLVEGVYPVNGWLLIVIQHEGYTCEMIAGEWESKLDPTNSFQKYYVLTDGERAFLLGKNEPLLTDMGPAGTVNGSFYVIKTEKSKEPYKNITMTVNGEPHNFTLLNDVTIEETYRLKEDCLEKVSECTIVTYPNGTVTRRCSGVQLNVSTLTLPPTPVHGSYVEIEGGKIRFTLEGKDHTAVLSEVINTSKLNLMGFKAKRGIVLVNRGPIGLPAGRSIDDGLLFFRVENRKVFRLSVSPNLNGLCARSQRRLGQTPPLNYMNPLNQDGKPAVRLF